MTSAAPAMPSDEKPLSEVERVVDTFVAPTKTFTDLKRSSNWLVPWVLMAISSVALVALVDNKLGMRTVVDNQFAEMPKVTEQLEKLPADQRAEQMDAAVKRTRVISYAYPVLIIVILAIIAAVLLGSFNFGLGAELKFNQCLAVCMYASLPAIIKGLLAMLIIFVGGGAAFTFQNPIASNLSGLVDPSSHFLHSVAMSVDVFMIWTLILTGIGFSCLTKVKRGTCMGVVFGWWAVVVLGGAGLSAMFS
jgi:hypothetical protein